MGKYSKAIIAVVGAVVAVLQTVFPTPSWSKIAVTLLAAFLVWLTPNKTQP